MHATFADPKTDFVFKRIFGAEARKPLLVALLNHLLELSGNRCIRDIQHLSSEQRVDLEELKLSIVDVKCTDASGRRFVVEMQVLKVEGFEKHVVYNTGRGGREGRQRPHFWAERSAPRYPRGCGARHPRRQHRGARVSTESRPTRRLFVEGNNDKHVVVAVLQKHHSAEHLIQDARSDAEALKEFKTAIKNYGLLLDADTIEGKRVADRWKRISSELPNVQRTDLLVLPDVALSQVG